MRRVVIGTVVVCLGAWMAACSPDSGGGTVITDAGGDTRRDASDASTADVRTDATTNTDARTDGTTGTDARDVVTADRVPQDVRPDTVVPPADTGGGGGSLTCGDPCTMHTECQDRCAAPSSGYVWCCSGTTDGLCFQYMGTSCDMGGGGTGGDAGGGGGGGEAGGGGGSDGGGGGEAGGGGGSDGGGGGGG